MREHGMSVRQSGMVQGLAVLLMLYHHLFNTPGALGVSYVSLLGPSAELRLAWFGKICVALYAFVTGYGICRVYSRYEKKTILQTLGAEYRGAILRIFRFYTVYWYTVIIYLLVEHFLLGRSYQPAELIPNLLGVMDTYNGSWWYAFEYAKLCLVLPLVDLVCSKLEDRRQERIKNVLVLTALTVLVIQYILGRTVSRSISDPIFAVLAFLVRDYLRCCVMGYLMARLRIFEWVTMHLPEKAEVPAGLALMAAAMAARIALTENVSEISRDFVIAPVFILGLCLLTDRTGQPGKLLFWFGRYSVYMWLIHLLFLDGFFKTVVCATHLSAGIFVTLTALSAGAAVLLDAGYRLLKKTQGDGRHDERTQSAAG